MFKNFTTNNTDENVNDLTIHKGDNNCLCHVKKCKTPYSVSSIRYLGITTDKTSETKSALNN